MDLPNGSQLSLLAIIATFAFLTYRWILDGRAPQASNSAPSDRKTRKDDSTFLVRGVPLDWDADRLQSLADRESLTRFVVKSLAHEIDGRSKTATVTGTFQNSPLPPQKFGSDQTRRILLPRLAGKQPTPNQYLTLDTRFLGINTLYSPPPEDHKVESVDQSDEAARADYPSVIALSGLGGHAFGSFKERGGDYMWLRDSLPYDITQEETGNPMARVMIYGYESKLAQSKSIQNLEDLATSFHNSLLALASAPIRPIILIAHSLGGLIVKQALISLSKSKNDNDVKFVQTVYGIVFFGVPHNGMDTSSLIPIVRNQPNRPLVDSISYINSQILSIQQREFHTALGGEGDSEVFCFYETLESPTAQKDKHGNWAMTGPTAVLVTKSSATHCRSWERGPEHICAIDRTHSAMIKFGPGDPEYGMVMPRLSALARRAHQSQERRLAQKAHQARQLLENKQYGIGARLLQEVVDAEKEVSPDSHARIENLCTLQWAWWKVDDKRQAEEVAKEAHEILERTRGISHPKTLAVLKAIADNIVHQGRVVERDMLYEEIEERKSGGGRLIGVAW